MVQLFRVSKIYPPHSSALVDVTLRIDHGEFVFINGPSGAGKTTLLRLMFREEEATEGQILIDGRNINRLNSRGVARLRRRLGLVFQDYRLLPARTALENVALAAEVVGVSRRESLRKAFHLLRELGLKDKHDARPPALSGGEQQKVAIARALVNEPALVLADEPTGNLDAEMADETMGLFLKAHEKGATVVIASHDTAMLKRFGRRILTLQRGWLMHDTDAKSPEGARS
jgi:cell division transport system ATP-binding protein